MSHTVLVAGGAGYIGSHVCKALAAAGHKPVVLDDLSAGKREFVLWGPLVVANVADTETVKRTVTEHGIQAVIDLAGSIEVGESVRDPLKYYDNNASAKVTFLRALSEVGVKAFVFSSTAAVYGEPQQVPIPESHPLSPKNPYGWSKLHFEHILRDFEAAGGPAWMALRYFNAAGASPDGEIGESHDPETHLIPRACLAALGEVPPLEVFGNDYPTPDGTAVRDYIHVLDLAQAHVLAVEALMDGKPSAAYNLGNGIGTSIGEVLASFEALGIKVPYSYKPRRAGDPSQLVADSSAAQRELNWKPQRADVKAIVESAYQWHKKRAAEAQAKAS